VFWCSYWRTSEVLPNEAEGSAVVCLKLFWWYVIPWVGDLIDKKFCAFNENSGALILVPLSSGTLTILTEVFHDIPQSQNITFIRPWPLPNRFYRLSSYHSALYDLSINRSQDNSHTSIQKHITHQRRITVLLLTDSYLQIHETLYKRTIKWSPYDKDIKSLSRVTLEAQK
jgi:hypothetical protein